MIPQHVLAISVRQLPLLVRLNHQQEDRRANQSNRTLHVCLQPLNDASLWDQLLPQKFNLRHSLHVIIINLVAQMKISEMPLY